MAQTTLGDLLITIRQEIAQTIEQTQDQTQDSTTQMRLYVSDVDLDLPAHVRFERPANPEAQSAHITVDLPNLRDTTSAPRLGRLHVTFAHGPTIDRA
ncbi:MAG: hypothetical protein HC824_07765 [Synechococcales cyanobacterium RM1_1_8]|nr:hypothetical protein [Synechococcales cyanobacterium RM1_1_8]